MANHPSSDLPGATEARLSAAAADARSVAGDLYFAGAKVDVVGKKVDVYLAHAPQSLVAQIEAMHPGLCVIHNAARNTLRKALALQESIDLTALRSEGIEVVRLGPTCDGYLGIGVSSDALAAQAALDTKYGSDTIRIYAAEPAAFLPYPPRRPSRE